MTSYGLREGDGGHMGRSKRGRGFSVTAVLVTAMLALEGLVVCGMFLLFAG